MYFLFIVEFDKFYFKYYDFILLQFLTDGIAIINIIAHIIAGFPVLSVAKPAKIPPMIPPTSNKVDKYPAVDASMPVMTKSSLFNFR